MMKIVRDVLMTAVCGTVLAVGTWCAFDYVYTLGVHDAMAHQHVIYKSRCGI